MSISADLQDALTAARKADEMEKAARKALGAVQAELDKSRAQLKQHYVHLERLQQEHRQEFSTLQQKLEDAEAMAAERAMQLSVVTDTVEALQVGTTSERDQRIVNLTAQLVASRSRAAGDERRCRQAIAMAKAHQDAASMLEQQNSTFEARYKDAETCLASLKHQLAQAKEELEAGKRFARDVEASKRGLVDEIARMSAAQDAASTKIESMQQVLQEASSRHLEELLTARTDAQRSRKHDLSVYLTSLPPPQYIREVQDQMSTLLAQEDRTESKDCSMLL
jgi:chromosome segregation ATPase